MNALQADALYVLRLFGAIIAIAGTTALIIILLHALWIVVCAADEFTELIINKLEVKLRRLRD